MRALASLSLMAVVVLASPFHAYDANANFKSRGSLPLCDEKKVVKEITVHWRKTDKQYYNGDLQIEDVSKIKESEFNINEPEETDRRFCSAKVKMSDGNKSTLYYLILEQGGLASIGWGVDFCIKDYDVHRAYGAHCRSVRAPF